jgi:hypothetical protein
MILGANPIGAGPIPGIAHEWTAGGGLHIDFFEVLGIGDLIGSRARTERPLRTRCATGRRG